MMACGTFEALIERKNMRTYILLVSSNKAFRSRVTAILRDKGYAVFDSKSFDEAQEIVVNVHIDIMCIDSLVGGARGEEFLTALHNNQKKCRLVLLAHPDRDAPPDAMEAPSPYVDLLLHKPISPEELVYKLETLAELKKIEDHESGRFRKPKAPAVNEGLTNEERQQELKESYAAKVPELFAELGTLLVQASNTNDSFEALQEAHRIAHMLNGTAGSLGFSDVSTAVHSVEGALKEMLRIRRLTSVPAIAPFSEPETLHQDASEGQDGRRAVMAKVLIVDTDEDLLRQAKVMGREHLIRVLTASTEEEAVRIVRENRVDAALISIILSGGEDAFQLARTLRTQGPRASLPVGFITRDSSMSKKVAAVHAGGTVFLNKPLDSDELSMAVRRLVPVESYTRPKVLIVDDDQDFLYHLELLLEPEGVETVTLESAANIVEEIRDIRPDILLLDVVMDQVNGIEACRVLRSMEEWRDLPILVLTVYGNRKTLLKCFDAGADDYIEKPIIKEELLARIKLRLDRIRMFRERADTDALTGLPTRRPFLNMLKMRISEGIRFNKPVSLCLIDLDNFKEVNDTYGHLAGDRVLAAFGRLLNSRFRTMDVRGRWGGEEFALAFYGEDADTTKMIVGRVLEEFKQTVFVGDQGQEFSLSFSAGIASFPSCGKSVDELFRRVDERLYISKSKGRSRIEM